MSSAQEGHVWSAVWSSANLSSIPAQVVSVVQKAASAVIASELKQVAVLLYPTNSTRSI